MNLRKMKKCLMKKSQIILIFLFITILSIFNGTLRSLPETTIDIFNSTPKQMWSPFENNISQSELLIKGNVTYYRLSKDTRYHYEFRFHLNNNNNNPRLMILLNGRNRTCIDYWQFSVGRRILSTLRSFEYSILCLSSEKEMFDGNGPVQNNSDVKWIYLSLQKWINEVYYSQFKQYPRLYIHGVSRGSKLGALLSRVLPIQAQILTINPGHSQGLLTPSDHSIEMQIRLQLDPVFANWFYFDFCYYQKMKKSSINNLCPFLSERNNYQPVSPSYFIHLINDPFYFVSDYTSLIERIRKDSFQLGGTLLNHSESINLNVLSPLNVTPLYMKTYFNIWNSKDYASKIFYQHFISRDLYKSSVDSRRTCVCLPTDFRYFEEYPNITKRWSQQKQKEYEDYLTDIKQFKKLFCEEVCGDLYAHHAMSSRNLDKVLHWINQIDSLRNSLYIKDYLNRPLRIWMYQKDLIVKKDKYFYSGEPNYVNISKQYLMYSPEYYIQDYFEQLKSSSEFSRHNFQWSDNPLLADYFIIPNDLTFYYFHKDITTMTSLEFTDLVQKINNNYFTPFLTNIRTIFPYWSMAKEEHLMGSNHIITILQGRNMGILHNNTQHILKNVIQLVFTGVRQDLLSPDAPPAKDFRGTIIVYRHGYDIVIPQYTELKQNKTTLTNLTKIINKKKRFFFFVGSLGHTMTSQSARPLLSSLWNNINQNNKTNKTITIEGKQFYPIKLIEGHVKHHQYIKLVQSTIFFLCPEGYFPWSPRIYEAIQIGSIPTILADNIVLPFERFIHWKHFSAKINVNNTKNIYKFIYQINNIEQYMQRKLTNITKYFQAFQWPYSSIDQNKENKHQFIPEDDQNGTTKNAFHYLSLELRCRRLEQLYGLTYNTFKFKSIEAQRQSCSLHHDICPCHHQQQPLAFTEYI